MGLLDDAIRHHLDLKRRRGDDPTEIARMEREALGPVRRGPEPFEAPYHRRPSCEPDDRRTRVAATHRADVAQATVEFDVLTTDDVEPAVTDRRVLVGAHAADGDVMRETPAFLQQTPEHDRLWFEQKPPQEFAF